MSCIIVGNSPSLLGKACGNHIDNFNTVIRLGDPIIESFESDVGCKTDILITRQTKRHRTHTFNVSQFKYTLIFEEPDYVSSPNLYFVYSKSNIDIDMDTDTIQKKLKLGECKPTLGMFAILLAQKIYKDGIQIIGIETDYNSDYSIGHYNDTKHSRDNTHHNILNELLHINKLLRRGVIHKYLKQ